VEKGRRGNITILHFAGGELVVWKGEEGRAILLGVRGEWFWLKDFAPFLAKEKKRSD